MTTREPGTLRDSFLSAVKAYMEAGGRSQIACAPTACCEGRIVKGMMFCTCWQPVFNTTQTEPDELTVARLALGETEPDVRPGGMCHDCAYRPNSPEKQGGEGLVFDAAELDRIAAAGERFYCHDGMRVPVAWQHPAGMRIPADPGRTGDYKPLVILNIPYRADGQPGLICAGWNARHRALTALKDPT